MENIGTRESDILKPNLLEKASGMRIDVRNKNENEIIDWIIGFREIQESKSRLVEYVTGMRPDDPNIEDKILADRKSVFERGINYDNNSIEKVVYESLIVNVDVDSFDKNDIFFSLIGLVNKSYREKSEKEGIEIKPVWNSVEYFLKNVDKIGDKKIEEYREDKKIDRIVEQRTSQGFESRLSIYITGMEFDDPEMLIRLKEDQKFFRDKYGLPNLDLKYEDPVEYQRRLMDLAKQKELDVVSLESMGANSGKDGLILIGQLDLKTKKLGVDMVSKDRDDFIKRLTFLEHEIIHGLQVRKSEKMPIEIMEYEAYIGSLDVSLMTNSIKERVGVDYQVTDVAICREVFHLMVESIELSGLGEGAVWKDNEYFLKTIDGLSEDQIQRYEKRNSIQAQLGYNDMI